MAEAKQEEVHPAKDKIVIVILRGSSSPPKELNAEPREGCDTTENYLNDIKEITSYIQINKKYYYLHKIYNMDESNDMKRQDVLDKLVEVCKFLKENGAMMIRLYYTGFGQFNTGNWCFDEIIKIMTIIGNLIISR